MKHETHSWRQVGHQHYPKHQYQYLVTPQHLSRWFHQTRMRSWSRQRRDQYCQRRQLRGRNIMIVSSFGEILKILFYVLWCCVLHWHGTAEERDEVMYCKLFNCEPTPVSVTHLFDCYNILDSRSLPLFYILGILSRVKDASILSWPTIMGH